MESITEAAEDMMIEELSFSLPATAKYVTERKFVTYYATGSNAYSSSQGTRVVKFLLSSEGWLDPDTLRFSFDVVNKGAAGTSLRPLGKCHAFFRRLRVLCRGVLLEDINEYSRVSQMFSLFQNQNSMYNDENEGFGLPDEVENI